MKNKKILITSAAAVAVALGIGSALIAHKNPTMVKADIEQTVLYIDYSASMWKDADISNVKAQVWGGSSGDYFFYQGGSSWSTLEISGKKYVALDMTGNQDFTGMQVYCWDFKSQGNISVSISPSDFSDGINLIIVGDSGSWSTKQPVSFGTLEVTATHTITKTGIEFNKDGTATGENWEILPADKVSDGDTYALPSRINHNGYHFGGWFTDEACTIAYVEQQINADLHLYAKYTSLSKDSYIYYVTGSTNQTNNMIHTWGGDVEYADRDIAIVDIEGVEEIHGVVNFQGTEQKIYKIPVSSESEDTGFNFHYNNWQSKSPDKALVAGNAYKWAADASFNEESAGDALDYIIELERVRNLVNEDVENDIKGGSICGISAEDASALCALYNNLSNDARENYVDNSFVWTYKKTDSSQTDNISIYDMMEQIAIQAGGASLNGHAIASYNFAPASSESDGSAIVIAISAVAVATAGYFFLRRRKEN